MISAILGEVRESLLSNSLHDQHVWQCCSVSTQWELLTVYVFLLTTVEYGLERVSRGL